MASVRSKALAYLQIAIAGMRIDDGYAYDWQNAYTRVRNVADFKGYPSCNITDGGQNYGTDPALCLSRVWSIRIDAAHKVTEENQTDGQTVADNLLSDLELLVGNDSKLGGLVLDVRPSSAITRLPTSTEPWVVASLTVEILYRTAYGDPSQPK